MTSKDLELVQSKLTDWRWRFASLYHINPSDIGRSECLFDPRPEQWEILEEIYDKGNTRLAILKARQLGFSTLLALICLDMTLFKAGHISGIVDQTQADAKKKLEKVLFAWDRLPPDLRGSYRVRKKNETEFTVQLGNLAASTVYAGTNARGGTHQLLWVSEWGAIQFADPRRSDEIADGALPSARDGIIVVETTWRGGKGGRLYFEVVEPARQITEEHRTREDWQVYFYPWWGDPGYVREGSIEQISAECMDYFGEIAKDYQVELSPQQMLWYYKTAWVKGDKRYEEFPSVEDEIYLSPIEGSIYGRYMDRARVEGRICKFPLATGAPVYTFWDLGIGDSTAIWWVQMVGQEIRIIDHFEACGEAISYYGNYQLAWEREHGLHVRTHFLPHDGNNKQLATGRSLADTLRDMGLEVVTVPRASTIWQGIDHMREIFPHLWIHAENCGRQWDDGKRKRPSGIECLDGYRTKPMVPGRAMAKEPLHDEHSHSCDALRTLAEAHMNGLVTNEAATLAMTRYAGRGVKVTMGSRRKSAIIRR